jgi:hypothetical protein
MLGFFIASFASCEYFYTKDKYLSDFENFVTEVEVNSSTYSSTEWDDIIVQYEEYNTVLYQKVNSQLAASDQQTIGRYKARFCKILINHKLKLIQEKFENGLEQLKGGVDEINKE